MPLYANIAQFMQRVNQANPKFERWKSSSLRPLLNVLSNLNGTPAQVQLALTGIPVAKRLRYKDALYYLQGTYPGLPPNSVTFGAIGPTTNAVRYTQTPAPVPYNPGAPDNHRITPACVFLNMTVEQYLISNPGTPIILIHLEAQDAGLNQVWNGASCLEHIVSAIRVGRDQNCPFCVLHMTNHRLLAPFELAIQGAVITDVHEPNHHMGGADPHFHAFVNAAPTVVVMGFDADVCVNANLFGSAQRMPQVNPPPPPPPWVQPLVTQANVVTSRSVLVTGGAINPTQYGLIRWVV